MEQPPLSAKQKIKEVFGWIFGVSILSVGFAFSFQFPLASIPLLLIGCMFIPPIGAFIDGKMPLSIGKKIGLVFISMILIVYRAKLDESRQREKLEAQQVELQKQAEEVKKKQQENIAYFNANSLKILADVRQAIKRKNYDEAVTLSSKYIGTGNKELSILYDAALIELQNKKIAKKRAMQLKQEQEALASRPINCKEIFNEVGFMPIMCLKQSFGEEYNVGLTDEEVVAVRNGNLDIEEVAEIENPEGWVTCYAYIRADAIVKGTSRVVNARCGFGRW